MSRAAVSIHHIQPTQFDKVPVLDNESRHVGKINKRLSRHGPGIPSTILGVTGAGTAARDP